MMQLKSILIILISLLVVTVSFGQDEKGKSKKVDKDNWKYLGSSVYSVRKGINVDSYFNKNKVEKEGQAIKFQIKEKPEKPLLFFKHIFKRLYEFNPDKYASFTHLITFFEGHCLERKIKVRQQEVWGTKDKEKPIITFKVERELEKVRSDSSKESDLLRACRQK